MPLRLGAVIPGPAGADPSRTASRASVEGCHCAHGSMIF